MNKQQKKENLKNLSLEKSNSLMLLLEEDGTPLCRLSRTKAIEKSFGSEKEIIQNITKENYIFPPRYSGCLTIERKEIKLNLQKQYHIYIKAKHKKTNDEISFLICNVKLIKINETNYNFKSSYRCEVSKDEAPWDKLKRMRDVDKDTFEPKTIKLNKKI